MSGLRLSIVSAEAEIFDGEVAAVFAPAVMGEVGVYPQHAPLLTTLKAGEVRARPLEGGEDQHFYVSGGILEVQPDTVTVLSDTALRGEDLDQVKAEESKRAAEEALQRKLTDAETAKALAELAEAAAQLRMIEELKKLRR